MEFGIHRSENGPEKLASKNLPDNDDGGRIDGIAGGLEIVSITGVIFEIFFVGQFT